MRYQKPVRGGRIPISAGVLKSIRREVEKDAVSHDCSKAFVINTILAMYYKVKIEERYDE